MKFFIGILIGVLLALGVSYYLNSSQFGVFAPNESLSQVNKPNSNVTSNTQLKASGTVVNLAPGTSYSTESATNDDHPIDYTFYKVLKDGTPVDNPQPQNNTSAQVKQVWAVVGVFENPSNAIRFKQQLSAMKFDVSLVDDIKNGKQVSVVMIGPLNNNDKANAILDQLAQNNIKYQLTKY